MTESKPFIILAERFIGDMPYTHGEKVYAQSAKEAAIKFLESPEWDDIVTLSVTEG